MKMTLYVEKDTLIHKIDPVTKLVYVITAAIIPYIVPDHIFALIIALISISLLFAGKVFRKMLPIFGLSLFLLLSMIIIHGIFRPGNMTPFIALGPVVFYKEGLLYALLLILRVINMLSAFGVLILTTKPDNLIEALVKRGMSPRIGYVIGSVLQIIPQMNAAIGTITDAQRSRGLETEGKLFTRIKAFIPLIGPVIMNSLIATRERSIALEVRGFNSKVKKTFLNEQNNYILGKPVQILLIFIFMAVIVWRIFL